MHFILRHQNPVSGEWEEKHVTSPPFPKKDTASHLYTLIVRRDNSFDILIDQESVLTGSLLEDMTPPVNPPKEIDDPADSKPEDWVDDETMEDLDASKPEDWDEDAPRLIVDAGATMPEGWLVDEPEEVPDPSAEIPDDWDEDEDGEWEAPTISNPKCDVGCGEWVPPKVANPDYKGKWYPPMIDNPAYKGEWKARQIPNAAWFEDLAPAAALAPMIAVAVEVWTMSGGIQFDNVVVGRDEAAAKAFADATFKPKAAAEAAARKAVTDEDRLEAREKKRAEGGVANLIEVYLADLMDAAAARPAPFLGTLLAVVLGLVLLCSAPGKRASVTSAEAAAEVEHEAAAKAGAAASAQASAAAEAEAEMAAEDDEEEKEEEDKDK